MEFSQKDQDQPIVEVPKDEVLGATGTEVVVGAPPPRGFKQTVWEPFLGPMVALTVICLVTSFLLGLTNAATAPLIEANTAAAADEAREELLPEADGFEEMPLTGDIEGAKGLYRATNGAGYVAEVEAPGGYGGSIPAMVAFDAEGKIAGVTFLENNETPGLGQKIRGAAFSGQFAGLPGQPVSLDDIDAVTSATVSSSAAVTAVNTAVALYQAEVLGEDVDGVAGATGADETAGATEASADSGVYAEGDHEDVKQLPVVPGDEPTADYLTGEAAQGGDDARDSEGGDA